MRYGHIDTYIEAVSPMARPLGEKLRCGRSYFRLMVLLFAFWQTVAALAATPTISSVSPNPMPGSTSNQTLTVNGANFQSTSTLTFHDPIGNTYQSVSSKLTIVSPTQITYLIDNND